MSAVVVIHYSAYYFAFLLLMKTYSQEGCHRPPGSSHLQIKLRPRKTVIGITITNSSHEATKNLELPSGKAST